MTEFTSTKQDNSTFYFKPLANWPNQYARIDTMNSRSFKGGIHSERHKLDTIIESMTFQDRYLLGFGTHELH